MMTNSILKYHYHPAKGWLNDPNGLSYFGGHYHVFYQHLPEVEYPGTAPMHWGHAITDDFLHYEELAPAIDPDMPYDAGGVWSGTAIEKDGKLYLYYAAIDAAGYPDGKSTICTAWSEDGVHFTKYENNPIIREYPADGSIDFRDPAILCGDEVNYLVIASADKKKGTGNVLLYTATDMLHWEYAGVLREYEDCRFCECPSFVRNGDRYILSVSVCPNNAPHYFEVLYGDFDGRNFTPEIVSHFQKGPDEYAGQIFGAPDGRAILMSWVSGWDYQPKEKCIGCLSLPLEVIPRDGKLYAYPIREVRDLVDADDTVTDGYVRERYINGGEEVYIELLEKP